MENKIDVKGFIQVCIVVEDIEQALDRWTALFNIARPEISVTKPSRSPDLTYRGEIAEYGMKMAVMQADGFVIELVEPDENPSTFRGFCKNTAAACITLDLRSGTAATRSSASSKTKRASPYAPSVTTPAAVGLLWTRKTL